MPSDSLVGEEKQLIIQEWTQRKKELFLIINLKWNVNRF